MKPILLRFRGLQSYIAQQEIDFTSLLDLGIFGIFGPTGSGKSTILDALTLSLYGAVERAHLNTQGIINQDASELAVEFEFSVGSGLAQRQFLVQRVYKRNKQNPQFSQMTQVRLIERGSEERVLAEKSQTVAEKIQEILGLDFTDFTRAVVLPQGRFAEFLSLKGIERRKMLERIFGLHQYGDQLSKKVKAREESLDWKYSSVVKVQESLGDASEEAVKEAQEKVADVTGLVEVAKKEAEIEEEAAKQAESLWKQLEALTLTVKELDALMVLAPTMEQKKKEGEEAEQAESLRHPLGEFLEDEKRCQKLEQDEKDLEQEQRVNEEEEEEARKELAEAEGEKKAKEPDLRRKQGEYQEALGRETEIKKLNATLLQLKKEEKTLEEAVQSSKEELLLVQGQGEVVNGEIEALAKEEKENQVSVSYRTQLGKTYACLQTLTKACEQKKKSVEQWEKEQALLAKVRMEQKEQAPLYQKKEEAVRQLDLQLTEEEKNPPLEDIPKKEREFKHVDKTVTEILRLEKEEEKTKRGLAACGAREEVLRAELERVKQELKVQGQACRSKEEELEQKRISDLARELAANLIEGSPCPVCGSLEHPEKAKGCSGDVESLTDHLASLREGERVLIGEEGKISGELLQMQKEREEKEADGAKIQQKVLDLRRNLPAVYQGNSVSDLQEVLQQEEESLEKAKEEVTTHRAVVDRLRKEKDVLLKEKDKQYRALEKVKEKVLRQESLAEKASENKALASEDQEKAERDFLLEAKGDTEETVWHKQEQLKAKDEALERIQENLAEKREHSLTLAKKRETLETKSKEKEKEKALKVAALEAKEQELKNQQEHCKELLGTHKDAREALAFVKVHLDALTRNEELAKAKKEALAKKLGLLRVTIAGVAASLVQVRARLTRNKGIVDELLGKTNFQGYDEVTKALRDDTTRAELQKQQEEYTQKLRKVREEKEKLEEGIKGRKLSLEEFEAIKEAAFEKKRAHEETLQKKGGLEEALSALVSKRARWQELEKERKEAGQKLATVRDLREVLKGNSFVEFAATQQLQTVAYEASEWLGQLTTFRYGLEVDSEGGFVIVDFKWGGKRRPTHTLSGGETFLTSLALAVALSNQIQLRGSYPLEFFFLDEGFGTLDPELLEVVMNSLERLNLGHRKIGLITHVPELRHRILRRVMVQHADSGSMVRIENG